MTTWVVLYALLLGFDVTCDATGDCSSRFGRFPRLEFNEVGDTVAGFGSLLAFVWLIVTVMLQSQELKAQRAELRQQRKEWEKISAAQDAQVEILKQQGKIFEDEQKDRIAQRADRLLERSIGTLVSHSDRKVLLWDAHELGGYYMLFNIHKSHITTEDRFSGFLSGIINVAESLLQQGELKNKNDTREVGHVIQELKKIQTISVNCSEAEQAWLERFPISLAISSLESLEKHTPLWGAD